MDQNMEHNGGNRAEDTKKGSEDAQKGSSGPSLREPSKTPQSGISSNGQDAKPSEQNQKTSPETGENQQVSKPEPPAGKQALEAAATSPPPAPARKATTEPKAKWSFHENLPPPDPLPTGQEQDIRLTTETTSDDIIELTLLPPIFDHRLSQNRRKAAQIDPVTHKPVKRISRIDSWKMGRMFSASNAQPVPVWVRWTLRYSATLELIRFVGMFYVFVRKVISRDTRLEDPQYSDKLIISVLNLLVGGTAYWCSYPAGVGKGDLVWIARLNELVRAVYMAFLLISTAVDDAQLKPNHMSMDLVWNIYLAIFMALYIALVEGSHSRGRTNSQASRDVSISKSVTDTTV